MRLRRIDRRTKDGLRAQHVSALALKGAFAVLGLLGVFAVATSHSSPFATVAFIAVTAVIFGSLLGYLWLVGELREGGAFIAYGGGALIASFAGLTVVVGLNNGDPVLIVGGVILEVIHLTSAVVAYVVFFWIGRPRPKK